MSLARASASGLIQAPLFMQGGLQKALGVESGRRLRKNTLGLVKNAKKTSTLSASRVFIAFCRLAKIIDTHR